MPEHTSNEKPAFTEHPSTYEELLEQKPDMHPELHAHVARLAAQTEVEEDMPSYDLMDAVFEIRDHADQVDLIPTANLEPDYTPSKEMVGVLRSHAYSQEDLEAFISTAKDACEVYTAKYDEVYVDRLTESKGEYGKVLAALKEAPSEHLQAIWNSPEDSQDLREMIEGVESPNAIKSALRLMTKIYELDDALDLADPHSQAGQDPSIVTLLESSSARLVIADTLVGESPHWPEDMDAAQVDTAKRDWADRYLRHVAKLPDDRIDEITFAAYSRVSDIETGLVDPAVLAKHLKITAHRALTLGPESTGRIREEAGIVNLDYYSPAQLKVMNALLQGDEEIIRHLQEGDVTVVMGDARGDYNGALSNNRDLYATPDNRTLFFEINRPSDIYRYMVLLKKYGIKPSTLVISAHGEKDGIGIGKDYDSNRFVLTNTEKVGSLRRKFREIKGYKEEESEGTTYSLVGSKGIARLVDEFMQPSRGIDDNPEAIGRKRVILDACLQDAPVTRYVKRPDSSDPSNPKKNKYRKVETSTAEEVTRAIHNPLVDVYANKLPFSGLETAAGLKHVDPDEKDDIFIPISHLTMAPDGTVSEASIEELVLRNNLEEAA